MKRYVTRAWSSETHMPEDRPTCQVYEPEEYPQDTGLLDANGVKIYRVSERHPIGFFVGDKT